MKDEQLLQFVNEHVKNKGERKELACAKAFEISHNHGLALKDIGRICNDNSIRIVSCQLGCF